MHRGVYSLIPRDRLRCAGTLWSCNERPRLEGMLMALYAFDGTWNEGKNGEDPKFKNTNVFRFKEAYARRPGNQVCYVAGVGTRFDALGAALGGAFGLGELPRLLETYDVLCKNWDKGDTVIDIVGFSRGAATTLDFCQLIQKRGIRKPGTEQVVEATPVIRFLGLWDVVAAFGLANLGNEALNIGHHLVLPKENLTFCFHAMALDERRLSFLNTRLPGACEVWFRGVHSDVGGGNGNRPLNDITLKWMMNKAIAAGLPIDPAEVPVLGPGKLDPDHGQKKLPAIRFVSAIDRAHNTVAPLDGWTMPPATCPIETAADEHKAVAIGSSGVGTQSDEMRLRILAMWETALAVASANGVTLDVLRDPLLSLFEARSPLVTDDAKMQAALDAVRRLIGTTIAIAREHTSPMLNEFFLNEALFKMPRVFPLTN